MSRSRLNLAVFMVVALAIALCGCGTLTASPSPSPSPAEPQVLELMAQDFSFSTDRLRAVAGRPIVIAFRNLDARIPHNFSLWRDDTRPEKLFHGEIIEGVEEIRYELGVLAPGDYYFECHPHLTLMNGYLIVE